MLYIIYSIYSIYSMLYSMLCYIAHLPCYIAQGGAMGIWHWLSWSVMADHDSQWWLIMVMPRYCHRLLFRLTAGVCGPGKVGLRHRPRDRCHSIADSPAPDSDSTSMPVPWWTPPVGRHRVWVQRSDAAAVFTLSSPNKPVLHTCLYFILRSII